jgi:SAM-dependent methyltransferase
MDRDDWNARYATEELVWTAQANRFVVAELDGMPPGRALDVAAGECRNAVWLAERGWDVTAVDYSATALEKGRRLAEARGVELTLVEADVTTYEPPRERFDLVLIAYLHLPEPTRSAVYARSAAAVTPGGTLLVVGHDRSNLDGGHGGPQDPAVLATPDEIAAALTGLAVERAERVDRPVETDDGVRIAIDHVVRARRP